MASVGFFTGLFDAALLAAVAYTLAALGELVSERAGILNLGVEGMMLVGALTGFATTWMTGNPYIGFVVAMVCGMLMASIHAFLTISLKSDQVVSGVMLTLLGTGLTTYFGRGWTAKSIDGFQQIAIPVLSEIPLVGPVVFESSAPTYFTLLLVPATWYFLFHTNLGLELSAVGDDPETADTQGVSVFRLRYLAVLIGGALAGAAGAHLSLAFAELWVAGMVAGRGWIAVALVIFAQWRPWPVLGGAFLFGALEALQLRSQGISFTVAQSTPLAEFINPVASFLTHPTIMSTYPYLATILVLVYTFYTRESDARAVPSALLQSYSRELD